MFDFRGILLQPKPRNEKKRPFLEYSKCRGNYKKKPVGKNNRKFP